MISTSSPASSKKPSRSAIVRGAYCRNALPPTATLIDRISSFGSCARTCSNGAWMSEIESAKKLRRCNTALTFSATIDFSGAGEENRLHPLRKLRGRFVHIVQRKEFTIKHLARRGCIIYVTLVAVHRAAGHLKKLVSTSRSRSYGAPRGVYEGQPDHPSFNLQ